MIKFKRILACVLAGATAVSLAACSSSSGTSGGEASNGTGNSNSAATTIDDDVENPVDVSDISIDAGDEVEPAVLEYLGCYDLRTAGDVKPAYTYFVDNYDCSIEVTLVGSLQIQERLTTAISSGDSPDLVDYADNAFPLLVSSNMYTPLDEYMDLSAPQWAGLEEYIDKYAWNGKHYYYPWSYNVSPYFLVYNRGLFVQLGLDDPKELYDEGNWTWDTFTELLRDFKNSGEDRQGIYGATQYTTQSIINSTGVPLIAIGDDGKLQNNFSNANVDRAANFMQSLKSEGLTKFPEGYINVDTDPIISGYSAFQGIGEWIITTYARAMTKDDALDIFFVPFPRDPEADEYYYSMTTFGYFVPAGSEYAEQAAVFINCCRLSVTDEALKETTKQSVMKNKKYTDEMYDFLMSFKEVNNFNAVIDSPYGLDDTTNQIIMDMIGNSMFEISNETMNGMSWTQTREANLGLIATQVDYYNGLMS